MASLPLFQYWHSDQPPSYITDLLATFRDQNQDLRHAVYDEPRAAEFIEAHFTRREAAAFRACAVPSMQADYFRYCAVLGEGGIYCDVGYRCIAPLRTMLDDCQAGCLFQRPEGTVVNGAFGFNSPGHPLLELTLEIATTNIERRAHDQVWHTTGPAIFTSLSRLRELESLDVFVAQSATIDDGNLKPVAQTLAMIGKDRDQAVSAFDGITITPLHQIAIWLDLPRFALPYKQSSDHWLKFESQIFR